METTDSIRCDIASLMEETNKSLDLHISHCQKKLSKIRTKKALLEKEESVVQDILSGFMSTKYPSIWRIYCSHSVHEHDSYYIGWFSSRKIAKSFIPSHAFCLSIGCHLTWDVVSVHSITLSSKEWEELDDELPIIYTHKNDKN